MTVAVSLSSTISKLNTCRQMSSSSIAHHAKRNALCTSRRHVDASALHLRYSDQQGCYQLHDATKSIRYSSTSQLVLSSDKIAAVGSTTKTIRLASSSSLYSKQTQYQKPWHDPSFMERCSPETVEQWLVSLLKSSHEKGDNEIGSDVDSIAYLRVLEAYAKSKIGGAPQKAEYWIGRLEKHYDRVANDYLRNNASSFDHAEQKVLTSDDGLDHIEQKVPTSADSLGTRDTGVQKSSFANLIASKKSLNNQTLQTKTYGKDASIVQSLQPTVECYNAVIEAWSNDTDKVSVIRSRRWLSKLESGIECPFPVNHPLYSNIKPDARSYDLYLHACSRGIGRQHRQHIGRAEEAEELLRFRLSDDAPLSIRPTTDSYNYCLRAWTRCRKEITVADRVMKLVREMEAIQRDYVQSLKSNTVSAADLWKEHISPNTKTYTMAIDAWVVVAGIKAKKLSYEQLKSDKRGHFENQKSELDDGTKEMESAAAILKYIQTLESAGRADVNASVIGYNTILSGYARLSSSTRPEIPLKSEAILREMMESCMDGHKHTCPDVMSFNAIIKAWASTGRPNSAARCEWWLRKMIKESNNNAVDEDEDTAPSVPKPNVNTYNLVMDAFLQLGDPSSVQNLLREMDASDFVSPNSESFSKVIRAWLHDEMNNQQKQDLPGLSCEHAFYWLKELLERERVGAPDLGSAPDLFASILKTAARTPSRGENLLSVGQSTFWAMRDSRFGVNDLAFEWLLEIALKVLEEKRRREEFIKSLVEQCCKDGFLSARFVSMIRSIEQEERFATQEGEEVVFNKYLIKPPFPATWTRNIRDIEHYHRV